MRFFQNLYWAAVGRAEFRRQVFLDINPLSGQKKIRILYKPNLAMQIVHWDLIDRLRQLRQDHISAQVAPFSVSPFQNVALHRRARYFFLLDIKGAYGQVDLKRLSEVLCSFDSSFAKEREHLELFLQHFCFASEGGLATGANASPDLFNIYLAKLVDEPLWELVSAHAKAKGDTVRYSRYLDDLTLSLQKNPWGSSIRWRIKKILKDAGLPLHRHKVSPPLDLQKGPITITGLHLQQGGRIFVPGHYRRLFRVKLRRAIQQRDFEATSKLAGMHGVFGSTFNSAQSPTRSEEEVADLFKEYRKLSKAAKQQSKLV